MASQTRKNRDKKARKMRRTLRNVFRKRSPESYLLRETKVGTPAARLRHYTIKIHIQTELTGKHVILFKRKLAVEPVQGVKFTATGLPKLPREPGAPYARPVVKGRNKAWDKLNKELGILVAKLLRRGENLRLPNPSYPHDASHDLIFHIRHTHWEACTRRGCPTSNTHYTGPMAMGGYKFALVPEAASEGRDVGVALVANLQVYLEGEFIKKPPPSLSEEEKDKKKKATLAGKILSGCKGHLDELRWLVKSLHLFDESPGASFEKQVAAKRTELARKHAAKRPVWSSSGTGPVPSPWTRFIAARTFDGARPGFTFRLGERGMGYYEDVAATAGPGTFAPVGQRSPDELGGWQGGGSA